MHIDIYTVYTNADMRTVIITDSPTGNHSLYVDDWNTAEVVAKALQLLHPFTPVRRHAHTPHDVVINCQQCVAARRDYLHD